MNADSKPWKWEINSDSIWLRPSPESHFLIDRWKRSGYRDFLDFGCGLGRHSILFGKEGFLVKAFDLSDDGVSHLKQWSDNQKIQVEAEVADMLELPYPDNSFDCILAYHVISHTTTEGILKIIEEVERVLRDGGEFYFTLCSKETWSFSRKEFPRLDENTILKVGGIEDGIPHFYVDMDDIFKLFSNFEIEEIRHIDDCYVDGKEQNSKHYFVLAKKKGAGH